MATTLAAWICACFATQAAFSHHTIASGWIQTGGAPPRSLVTSAEIDSTWRFTRYGWQDSAAWPAADSYVPTKTIELLNPLVWAGIVLIAVIGTMIWASSEWEIARLFETNEESDQQTKEWQG